MSSSTRSFWTQKTSVSNILKEPTRINISSFLHHFIVSALMIISLILSVHTVVHAVEINGPEIKIRNNAVSVSTSVVLDDQHIQELQNGIKKKLQFHIDIFRVWNMWPDEFITGRFLEKTLQYDPVKGESLATSYDGSVVIEKRFKSFESMLDWALGIQDMRLRSVNDLEPGNYYVKVSVESKIRQLPPVIGYFMIFLPENDFTVKKNSRIFSIEPQQ